jgi:hypothetical protein
MRKGKKPYDVLGSMVDDGAVAGVGGAKCNGMQQGSRRLSAQRHAMNVIACVCEQRT